MVGASHDLHLYMTIQKGVRTASKIDITGTNLSGYSPSTDKAKVALVTDQTYDIISTSVTRGFFLNSRFKCFSPAYETEPRGRGT